MKELIITPVAQAVHDRFADYYLAKAKKLARLEKQKAFLDLVDQINTAKDTPALLNVCESLVTLATSLKKKKSFSLFGSKKIEKNLGRDIAQILSSHDITTEYFKAGVLNALRVYKNKNEAAQEIIAEMEAAVLSHPDSRHASSLRETLVVKIHRAMAQQISLTSDQQDLIDTINDSYFIYLQEKSAANNVLGHMSPSPDAERIRVQSWIHDTRSENKRETRARRVEIKRREDKARVDETNQAIKMIEEAADEYDSIAPALDAVIQANQQADEQRRVVREEINQALIQLEEILETPEAQILTLTSEIEQKEEGVNQNQTTMAKRKERIQLFLRGRQTHENNLLLDADIDVTKVARHQEAFNNELTRETALKKAADKWWNFWPIKFIPAVKAAYQIHKDTVRNYLKNNFELTRVENIVELPYSIHSQEIATIALTNLKASAKDHEGVVSADTLRGNCDETIRRVGEYFGAYGAYMAEIEPLKVAKVNLGNMTFDKMEHDLRLTNAKVIRHMSVPKPQRV
ncbi:MAG TPA: hypothetical protein VGV92_00990 [Gammaproteobacteria bacterium]|nr:hypothetical protein [Gammaproteobacteria bacterium]